MLAFFQADIVVHQGDVEDWTIENRSHELHAFHIHQIHFLLVSWNRTPVNDTFLRDTINIPYWDGKSDAYPSVTLRMDFRDPNSVGTFVYHCHLLEHEDGGMMGTDVLNAQRSHTRVTPASKLSGAFPRPRAILGPLDILVDIGALAEKEVIQ